jgi:hypothetical protein
VIIYRIHWRTLVLARSQEKLWVVFCKFTGWRQSNHPRTQSNRPLYVECTRGGLTAWQGRSNHMCQRSLRFGGTVLFGRLDYSLHPPLGGVKVLWNRRHLEISSYTIITQDGPFCKTWKDRTIRFKINPNKQHLSFSSPPFSTYYHNTSIVLPLPSFLPHSAVMQCVRIPNGKCAQINFWNRLNQIGIIRWHLIATH